jgi:nucleotide-binding universal stress UspA family protein
MFTSLLVGYDGSPMARIALSQAILIGKKFHSRIVVATVAQDDLQEIAVLQREAVQLVEAAGVGVSTVTRSGEVAEVLRGLAEDVGVVVVGRIGTRGRSSRSIDPLGPDTRELIRRCPRPVLVTGSEPTELTRVLVAHAGGPEGEGVLAFAGRFAGIFGAHLDVLHVTEDLPAGRQVLARASGALSITPLDFDTHLAEGSIEAAIVETIEDLGSNVLFVGAERERHGWLVPSHTEAILRATDIPVVVYMPADTSGDRINSTHRRSSFG